MKNEELRVAPLRFLYCIAKTGIIYNRVRARLFLNLPKANITFGKAENTTLYYNISHTTGIYHRERSEPISDPALWQWQIAIARASAASSGLGIFSRFSITLVIS